MGQTEVGGGRKGRKAEEEGCAHPVGEGEGGQRLSSLHPGTGRWVGAALGGGGDCARRGIETPTAHGGGEADRERPSRYKAKAAGGTGCRSECVCGGRGGNRTLPSAFLRGKTPKTSASARVGRGPLRGGKAPPALQETPVARWRVALRVRPTPRHPEDAPSRSDGGTAAGWLRQEDAAPRGSSCTRLVLKEVMAVEGAFSRLPEAVCPSRRS